MKKNKLFGEIPESEMELVLICAVRYGLGRKTYVPSSLCQIINSTIQKLSNNTVRVLIRDIEGHGERFSYGMDFDKKEWMGALDALKSEQERRGLRMEILE